MLLLMALIRAGNSPSNPPFVKRLWVSSSTERPTSADWLPVEGGGGVDNSERVFLR